MVILLRSITHWKEILMLRTFIAVDFPPEIIQKIEKIIAYFKTQTPDEALKWISTNNLHLTLKFLGEIPEEKLDHFKNILANSLGDKPEFNIGVEGLGMYPDKRNPRVIWLGITAGDTLIDLHKTLDSALASAEIEREKRDFTPHLTIARVRRGTKRNTISEIGEILSLFKVDSLGNTTIKQVVLYQSELTPKGPIYTRLMTLSLNKV
jgi:RNA 2',3'-cyclic 3'-phosphodiesterase